MPDDAGVLHQARDITCREAGDALGVEALERLAEVLAFAQDRQPAQPRLETFETDFLEEPVIVADRAAPLLVVIADVRAILARPPAACAAVRAGDQSRAFMPGGTGFARDRRRRECEISLRLGGGPGSWRSRSMLASRQGAERRGLRHSFR